jgi:small conductance mechanosensitive channel
MLKTFLKDPPSRIGVESLEADAYKVRINIWVKAHGFNDLRLAFQERLIQQFKNAAVKLPWNGIGCISRKGAKN